MSDLREWSQRDNYRKATGEESWVDALGPLRIVKCVRCGKDKWRGPDDVCFNCRKAEPAPKEGDHAQSAMGSGAARRTRGAGVRLRVI